MQLSLPSTFSLILIICILSTNRVCVVSSHHHCLLPPRNVHNSLYERMLTGKIEKAIKRTLYCCLGERVSALCSGTGDTVAMFCPGACCQVLNNTRFQTVLFLNSPVNLRSPWVITTRNPANCLISALLRITGGIFAYLHIYFFSYIVLSHTPPFSIVIILN